MNAINLFFGSQRSQVFGNKIEMEITQLIEKNPTILRLGLHLEYNDARHRIATQIQRNIDTSKWRFERCKGAATIKLFSFKFFSFIFFITLSHYISLYRFIFFLYEAKWVLFPIHFYWFSQFQFIFYIFHSQFLFSLNFYDLIIFCSLIDRRVVKANFQITLGASGNAIKIVERD